MEKNVGESGYRLHCNANYNLSLASALTVEITRPDKTIISGPATLGTVASVTEDKGTFAANQYAIYPIVEGDFNQAGEYIVRLTYLDGTKKLISVPDSFVVYA